MKKITDNCCGCGACANVCNKNAIYMKSDTNGFIHAAIDANLCVDCEKCKKVCPVLRYEYYKYEDAYAAASLDVTAKKSSSGGMFALIAKKFFEKYTCNGIVYGTALSQNFDAYVIGIESAEKLSLLQGSKYTQSEMGNVYNEIKQNIADGKKVLFCGTPCQVSAIKNFIGDNPSLYVLDIVCHGVPNNKMFKDYIRFIEKKYKNSISEFIFRDKSQGQDIRGKILFSSGAERKYKYYESSYYALFLNGSIYRESCYSCRYANTTRVGDITLCDYWGVDVEEPEFSAMVKEKGIIGISGVILNSDKGKELFEMIKGDSIYKRTTKDKIARHNPNLLNPSPKHEDRKKIFELYKSGYGAVDKYYHKKYKIKNFIRDVYEISPTFLKEKIDKLRGCLK